MVFLNKLTLYNTLGELLFTFSFEKGNIALINLNQGG